MTARYTYVYQFGKKQKMNYLLILIFVSLFSTNSARWYLANVENVHLDVKTEIMYPEVPIRNNTNYKLYDSSDRTFDTKSNNYTFQIQPETLSDENNWKQIEDVGKVYFNKTLSNQTSTKTFRPKRKILPRRCIPQRKSKHFNIKSSGNVHSRFLEVFEVIEFDHISCTSSNGLDGTCLHEYDCHKAGGTVMGSCADGHGTCCIVLFTCEGRSSAPVGWFTNAEFPLPSSDRVACILTLYKTWPVVKQFRLDFHIFEMLPPTSGNCEQDQFIVTGQNVNNIIPILCGINTGQHVYIEVSNVDGPISLSIQTVTAENRLFAVKIAQLTSDHELAAPTGCLQYFKGPQGHLESFNYRARSEILVGKTSSYLNNLNYAMCIERQSEACTVTYTNVGCMQIVNYDTEGLPIIPPRQAGVEIFNCPSDWLLISAVRLCGERLNDGSVLQDFALDAPITDSGVGPIIVWFRSDGSYSGRGFKLHYLQNSCLNPS